MRYHNNLDALLKERHRTEATQLDERRKKRHDELMESARTLMIEGRDDEALAACEETLRVAPHSEQALLLASTLSSVRGRCRDGLSFALEMVQKNQEDPDGYYEVGMSLLDLGYPEEAIAWLSMGRLHTRDDDDELLDFFDAAEAEALALLARYDDALSALEEGHRARGDKLGLLEDAAARVKSIGRHRC